VLYGRSHRRQPIVGVGVVVVLLISLVVLGEAPGTNKAGDMLRRGLGGPTYIADPVGLMFRGLHDNKDSREASQGVWLPNFVYNEPNTLSEKLSGYADPLHPSEAPPGWEVEAQKDQRLPEDDILDSFTGLYIPCDEEGTMSSLTQKRDPFTRAHVTVDAPEYECSGRGEKLGDMKNICSRRDCHVTVMYCPPDMDTEFPTKDYGTANLTECRIGEMKCMDTPISFDGWRRARIHELLCDNQVTKPEDGDLDHCSLLSVIAGNKVFNLTLAPPEDDKCWIDMV
jgi:hypothetical protein